MTEKVIEKGILYNIGRTVAGSYEDQQQVRISSTNRLRDLIRKKIEEIPFDEVEEKKEKKDHAKKYTDEMLIKKLKEAYEQNKISQFEHKYIIDVLKIAKETESLEQKWKRNMLAFVKKEPIYKEFFSKVSGIGPVLSTKLLKVFGYCEDFKYPTKLYKYTGNHVVNNKAPKRTKGQKTDFSVKLRTLTYQISECLLRSNKGYYRMVYVSEKKRQMSKTYPKGVLAERYNGYKEDDVHISKNHAHMRALRKIRKLFLYHYWECARSLKGLPVTYPYIARMEPDKEHNIVSWEDVLALEGSATE